MTFYPPPPRALFAHYRDAEQLARMIHEAYERHAVEEFGYMPRKWESLTQADRDLKVAVSQELLDRRVLQLLPDCPHDMTVLKRVEARQCLQCGSFPRLCRHNEEPVQAEERGAVE